MQDYPYDHAIYRPGKTCSTCNHVKPARSKHCSLCGCCVAKCDHHCPWVMNCLGRGNYQHFLALLLSLGTLQVYGAYLSYCILENYLHLPENPNISMVPWQRLSEFGEMCTITLHAGGLGIAGVGLLAAATAFLPLSFLAYHIYLIWAGMTTNESQKWADWRDDMADGAVFRASRKAVLEHLRLQQGLDARTAEPLKHLVETLGLEAEEKVFWPAETDQIIVRTNDCQPPSGQAHLWFKVYDLSKVENLYDLGVLDNLSEIVAGR
ncbi:zf-DHHC-domain-containing protein [Polychaeton citri CBS 116435]|uniref:Palmitoyltransferase n=1 Tax=Polychaeton citri CBS 116435 TaxID=1314669 RepID=A0A9P4QJP6_9PEZI|nr:zf-DHHC-domain-containing protein [Polychaeton citri CBS 116435]